MSKEIAVFLDENGKTSLLDEEGIIKVFRKEDGKWKVIKKFLFSLNSTKGLKSIREQLCAMADTLGECRVLIAQKVTGLPYTVLDMRGYNIWEIEGEPGDFLDSVLEGEEQSESTLTSDNGETEMILTPMQIGNEGYYSINLKYLQERKVNVSSKQVLLPFLKNTVFYELEIICSHIPPWFEIEFETLNLEKQIINIGKNEYKVIVRPKTCNHY